MVKTYTAKVLLVIACIFGFLEGLMALTWGPMIINDKEADADNGFRLRDLQTGVHQDTKYGCGDIMLTNPPTNLWAKDEDCTPKYDKMDRGWYKRVYNYCKNVEKSGREYPDVCNLNGYKVILAYTIVCGVGWVLTAVVVIIAIVKCSRKLAYIAAIAFIVFYLAFLGFYVSAWNCSRKFNKKCLDHACDDVKKRGKKSFGEFYICAMFTIVLILAAIILSFIGACGLSPKADPEPKSDRVHAEGDNGRRAEERPEKSPAERS